MNMYVFIYMYIYIYMYVCMYIHIYICIYTYIRTNTYIHIYIYTYTHVSVGLNPYRLRGDSLPDHRGAGGKRRVGLDVCASAFSHSHPASAALSSCIMNEMTRSMRFVIECVLRAK